MTIANYTADLIGLDSGFQNVQDAWRLVARKFWYIQLLSVICPPLLLAHQSLAH